MIENGAKTGEEIKQVLANITFEGASGKIEFNKFGEVFDKYDILVVKDREFILTD